MAQRNYRYHTESKKAIKLFEMATDQYDLRKNVAAQNYLLEALEEDPKFIEAHTLLGDVYFDLRKFEEAAGSYRSAILVDSTFFPKTYMNLARAEMQLRDYKQAISSINSYLRFSDLSKQNVLQANAMLELARFRSDLIARPVPFKPLNLGPGINTEFNEYIPTITADNQTLIFTRRFPKTEQTYNNLNYEEEDLYSSIFVDEQWIEAVPLSRNINSDGNEGSQCLSPDGKILFFTACDRKSGYGSCDIYYSKKSGNDWSLPQNIGRGINSEHWESQPSISADGKKLYFVSNRPGGKGLHDIWMSEINENGFWTKAVNLGDSINTRGKEFYPFIHPDNRTLYFSSDGHMGMGSMDIFYSRKTDDHVWSKPVNIGYPINDTGLEHGLVVSNDGLKGYFASERFDGMGNLDLYSFDLYEAARPQVVSYIKGIVYDSESKSPLEAEFEIVNLETGELLIQASSDKVNGEFLISLPAGKDYALNVSRPGYLFYSDHFSSSEAVSRDKAYLLDVAMKKTKAGESVVLRNIFFESNSFVLLDRSKAELDKLLRFLEDNPGVGIEISGHTDDVGSDADNLLLSKNRAEAVYNFLIKRGIASSRLMYKGFGESAPLADNSTEEGRASNRRTEFKIISVE